MQGESPEKCKKFYQAASGEDYHVRLLELIREIDQILLERELRLHSTKANGTSDDRVA